MKARGGVIRRRWWSGALAALAVAPLNAQQMQQGPEAQQEAAAPQSAAVPAWFTILGDPRNMAVDTVEVDPVALRSGGASKAMHVRVSRAEQRTNWDGVPYRSYESQVLINCRTRKAHYVSASFYMAPLWQGGVHHRAEYVPASRPMLFRDVEPNPTDRIVRAACAGSG